MSEDKNNIQYVLMELRKSDLHPDPFVQFAKWYDEASVSGIKFPEAVTLCTSCGSGVPSSRIVLYKGCDQRGFRFYTNSHSRKGIEMKVNPYASLCFWWEKLERQVRICGAVEMLSTEESDRYFSTRPRGSQIGAWASSQSSVIESRELLEQKYRKVDRNYKDKEIPRPGYWNGYVVIPSDIEFWQGRPNRLHDRLRYRQNGLSEWIIERLEP